ncbi:MAG: hypothetical protein LUG60_09450 [Erysipelotrichaceae bacterium]|nr:hypothetical protein [Erysipelotrichaceae bacterium]
MPIPKAVSTMAIPMIISQIIVLIYNMADTFYVGRTNNPYMVAGISMILPIFNISLSLAGLTGVGGGTLISRLLGINEEAEGKKVCTFSIYFALVITAIFSIGMLIFMDPLLKLVGASSNTFEYARQYTFFVIVIGGIPTVLSNVMSNLVRSVGYSSKASFGIATLISNCTACFYFIFTILKTNSAVLSLNIKAGIPQKDSIKSIFMVGIPSSITTLLFDLDYVILDRLMVTYGDIPLAAIGIVLKAERFPLNVGIGICQGIVPLVAYNYSSKNYKRMNNIISFSRRTGLIIGILSIVIYELFAVILMQFFISDASTVTLGTNFLRVRILATPLMFLCFSMVNIFNAFGEGQIALFLGVTRWAVINIPMLFILNALFGIYGLVWSQLISDTLMALISQYVYVHYRKKNQLNIY